MKLLVLLTASFLLAGCVEHSTYLSNSRGQYAHCIVTGWGLAGTALAEVEYRKCMDRWTKAGFTE